MTQDFEIHSLNSVSGYGSNQREQEFKSFYRCRDRDIGRDDADLFPEADGRKILGDNAIAFYGLDRDKLQAVADDIGPTASIFN